MESQSEAKSVTRMPDGETTNKRQCCVTPTLWGRLVMFGRGEVAPIGSVFS